MKFIISSSILLKNLQSIQGVINSNNTLPILDDFLFELKEDVLIITSSDLETTMRVNLKLDKSEEQGSVAIPAKILVDTLKTFADIPISFTIDPETLMIEISAGEGKYKLSGHKGDEYPRTPTLEETTSIHLDSKMMAQAINKTLFATGNDELRLVLSGIFCELSPEDVTFVATDAHKLVRYKRTDLKSNDSASFILPKKPMNLLKNILSGMEIPVTIEYNKTNAFFSFSNIHLICRLIDGKYPNYDAVIPKENPNILVIDRHALLTTIRRVSIFANQSTHQIRFKVTGQELLLSAEDVDFSNEARERLSCAYEGEDMEIGFNSKFLLEMLNNIDTDEIRLEMSAPNRAGILTPVNNENKEEDILMLVMPVMLNK
ncbi:MAG: DNA polymerase III subunit beta [Bacteroidales bacterium]|nr:DNA polymerase III subunit beta [Bacteroidales bacterium]MDD4603020.1 DNA polymerase III subunit beta [Bacteroidales bacterium]